MDGLHEWLEAQLAEHKTEPNSGLGQAIRYLLRHWQPLTLFLRQVGAPLDNNLVERSLKRAVLHRKNSLFYRTLNGAQVVDVFMSLIHTCQLCDVNSFDYLAELCGTIGNWLPTPRYGCPGITASNCHRLTYDESCLAEKDRLRPGRTNFSKMAKGRRLRTRN